MEILLWNEKIELNVFQSPFWLRVFPAPAKDHLQRRSRKVLGLSSYRPALEGGNMQSPGLSREAPRMEVAKLDRTKGFPFQSGFFALQAVDRVLKDSSMEENTW